MEQGTRPRAAGRIIFASILLAVSSAQAHDDGRYASSPLKPWFEILQSKGGGKCCANADGIALSGVDWDTKHGHYRVRLQGQWVDVPDNTVIKQPNLAGRTMVWPHYLLRGPTGRALNLRHPPELRFVRDQSAQVGLDLAAIIREDEEKARAVGRVPGEDAP